MAYQQFEADNTSGDILLQEHKDFGPYNNLNDIKVTALIEPDSVNINSITLNDNISLSKIDTGYYHYIGYTTPDIYGKSIYFHISPGFDVDSLYLSPRIIINEQIDSITNNQDLTWNEDPQNDKGVVIEVSFNRGLQLDTTFQNDPNVENYYWTPDDGTFTLTDSLFTNIPSGAFVFVSLYRGNYKNMFSIDHAHRISLEGLTEADTFIRYYRN